MKRHISIPLICLLLLVRAISMGYPQQSLAQAQASRTITPVTMIVHTLPTGVEWTTYNGQFVTITDSRDSLSSGIILSAVSDLRIDLSGAFTVSSNTDLSSVASLYIRVLVDGQPVNPPSIRVGSNAHLGTQSFSFVQQQLPSGGHWVEVQWKVDAGGRASLSNTTLVLSTAPRIGSVGQVIVQVAPDSGKKLTLDQSQTWKDIPSLSTTIDSAFGEKLAATISAEAYVSGNARIFLRSLVDGQPASPSDVLFVQDAFGGVRSFTFVTDVQPGKHAVTVQWSIDGTGIATLSNCSLAVNVAPQFMADGGLNARAATSGPNKEVRQDSWTNVPDMSIRFAAATNSGIAVTFSAEASVSGNARMYIRTLVDNRPINPSEVVLARGQGFGVRSFTFTADGLSAGNHDVIVQWRVDRGAVAAIGDRTVVANYWRSPVPNLSQPLFGALRPIVGARPVLAVLWDPHRAEHPAPSIKAIDQLVFGSRPSVRDYFLENSGGRMQLQRAGVLGWYDAKYPASHYWEPRSSPVNGWIHGHDEKWAEAIRDANEQFNFRQYDVNGDNYLSPEELTILIVIPQNDPFGTQRSVVGQEVPREPLVVDGVKIDTMVEAYIGQPPNLPLVAHELAHILTNAADMYFTTYAPLAACRYSLMDRESESPHLDAIHKLYLGWLTPQVANQSGWYTLHDVERTGDAIILRDPARGDKEFFVIENRWAGKSYEQNIPDSGLAIWRIVTDPNILPNLPTPRGMDSAQWQKISGGDWGRRAISIIRPIYGDPCSGSSTSLWHGPEGDTGYDISPRDPNPNHIVLRWADGTPANFVIQQIPSAGPEMRLFIAAP